MTNLLDWSRQRGAPRGQENWSELQPENKLHYAIIYGDDDNDIHDDDEDDEDEDED